ncbi:MAG: hypothetical protein ACK4N5_18105 [Myxococcales bacterium]
MKRSALSLLVALLSACSGTGNLAFTVYGEDFIEDRIPAGEEGVVDGWTITFDRFLVTVAEITVAGADGEVAARQPTPKLFNLKQPGPVPVERFTELPSQEYPNISFALAPAKDALPITASVDDAALMVAGGYSVFVSGEAVRGSERKTFRWGFTTDTLYEACEAGDLGAGATVPDGSDETVQLTIHGDHLFFDHLASDDAKMRFDAFAAADKPVTPGGAPDGEITLAELAAVDLTELPAGQYGTGSIANVNTLRDFVTAQVRSIGHFRGEGECRPRAR